MKYETLKKTILNCNLCQTKFGFQPHPFVWGNPNAKIVQISQAPSKKVHETGIPFNDLSGRRLRQWYGVTEDLFYNKKIFYMTAISHCYPGKDMNGKDIKPPFFCAKKWLRSELSMLHNDIYIIVGRFASTFLFPNKTFTELVYSAQTIDGKPAYVIPHPSPQNIKWFKDHPEFCKIYLPKLRSVIHNLLKKSRRKIENDS